MNRESFAFSAGLVKGRSGLVLTPDQGYMLETRLGPLLKREGLPGIDALAQRLKDPRATALAEAVAGEDEHRGFHPRGAQPAHHLVPLHVREDEVEHDHVVIVEAGEFQRLLPGVDGVDDHRRRFQHRHDRAGYGHVIFNQKGTHAGGLHTYCVQKLAPMRGL